MGRTLAMVTVVVRDYDEAIAFYSDALQFRLLKDEPVGDGKRWVVMSPGDGGADILLARAVNIDQESRIGNQTGGRVSLFLRTDDFCRDYAFMNDRGVRFVEEPRQEAYGTVAVFLDLYGNRWDLIGPRVAAGHFGSV
ncbi:MAG: VOC family protein [Gemmataceae bacterium]|nr:VOC family protein [Gemmataceae bacterium]